MTHRNFRLTATSCALLLLVLGTVGGTARANRRLALQAYTERVPEEGLHYVGYLLRTLGEHAPMHGEALKKLVNARLSQDPGDDSGADQFRESVAAGRQHFIEGEYAAAIEQLSQVRQQLLAKQSLIAADQTLRKPLHRATLFLAHAYLRQRDNTRAVELVSEVIRSFPDRELSLVHHGPDLVQLYKKVRLDLRGQERGTLLVETTPRGCMVFVNERYVGLSPARLKRLYPGQYRVYIQRPDEPGRVHLGNVTAGDHKLTVDFELDRVLRTTPEALLLYSTAKAMKQYEQQHAVEVGRRIEASEVLLLGIRRYEGRRMLQGTVLAVATGRPVRTGLIALEPATPAPAEIKALGRFLVLGEPGDGVIVRGPDEVDEPASSGPSWGVWRWITLGVGAATLGTGIALMATRTSGCDSVNCSQIPYDTFELGLGLTIAGSAVLVGSAVLFALHAMRADESAEQPTAAIGPWFARGAGGLNARVRF